MRDPDGEGLAFIQGEGGTSRGLKSKGEVKYWHYGGPHFKSECPKLKLLDTGIQNLNIDDCSKDTVCSWPTMATGSFRSRQKECEAFFTLPRVHQHMHKLL